EPVVPRRPAADIGEEATGEQGLQDRVGRRLGEAQLAGELGEPGALAALASDEVEQIERAAQALHPVARLRRCSRLPAFRHGSPDLVLARLAIDSARAPRLT